jgi:hypothetical protein
MVPGAGGSSSTATSSFSDSSESEEDDFLSEGPGRGRWCVVVGGNHLLLTNDLKKNAPYYSVAIITWKL